MPALTDTIGRVFATPRCGTQISNQGLGLRARRAPAYANAGLQGGLLHALCPKVGDGHRLVLLRQRLQSLQVRRQGLGLVAARVFRPSLTLCKAYEGRSR